MPKEPPKVYVQVGTKMEPTLYERLTEGLRKRGITFMAWLAAAAQKQIDQWSPPHKDKPKQ